MMEVGGGGEVGAVAGRHCGMTKAGGDVGFPDSGRSDQQHVGRGLEVAAGAELSEQGPVDARGGVEVEVVEGGAGGEVREAEPAGEAAGVGRGDLDGEQPLEGVGEAPALGLGLVKDAG